LEWTLFTIIFVFYNSITSDKWDGQKGRYELEHVKLRLSKKSFRFGQSEMAGTSIYFFNIIC